MTQYPQAGYISVSGPSGRTEGEQKQFLEDLLAIAKETPGGSPETELTISAGSVTPTGALHRIDTEADDPADELTHVDVTNHSEGRHLFLRAEATARAVTVKHAAGSDGQVLLALGADMILRAGRYLWLVQRDDVWHEVTFLQGVASSQACIRLSLSSTVAIPTSDQFSQTQIHIHPFGGNALALYSASAGWSVHTVTADSLKVTDTQIGDTVNTSTSVSGLHDTSQLIVGMEVTGAGIPASTTIAQIDSASSITLSQAATATANGVSLTFKMPANKMVDVFAHAASGAVVYTGLITARTDNTGLALQDGIWVKSGDPARRYLGSIATTAVAGECEDSASKRYVWNLYNQVERHMAAADTTDTWPYSTAQWRQANGSTSNEVNYVAGLPETLVTASVFGTVRNDTSTLRGASVGVGIDSATVNSALVTQRGTFTDSVFGTPTAHYKGYPGAGLHSVKWLEIGAGFDTQTWHGDNGVADNQYQNGLLASITA